MASPYTGSGGHPHYRHTNDEMDTECDDLLQELQCYQVFQHKKKEQLGQCGGALPCKAVDRSLMHASRLGLHSLSSSHGSEGMLLSVGCCACAAMLARHGYSVYEYMDGNLI
eukprot:1160066-Pelagomonas_calceolata.AAC.11